MLVDLVHIEAGARSGNLVVESDNLATLVLGPHPKEVLMVRGIPTTVCTA